MKDVEITDFLKTHPKTVIHLGLQLHKEITASVISNLNPSSSYPSEADCIEYIHNRTFDGYLREKSVVNDGLAKVFPDIVFEESPTELDHAGDIDYMGYVGDKAFGIQIKPVTARSNFGNYSPSERMKANFQDFEAEFGGKVFIVFSLDGEIANRDVLKEIESEVRRLRKEGT